jgi:hypothetical protein
MASLVTPEALWLGQTVHRLGCGSGRGFNPVLGLLDPGRNLL